MDMTLEQVRDWHRKEACSFSDSKQEKHAAMANAIEAHLARQSDGVSDEGVERAHKAYWDTPDDHKGDDRPAIRAALTAVWHNRPVQDSDAYRQGFIDGSKAVSEQEKAEPAACKSREVTNAIDLLRNFQSNIGPRRPDDEDEQASWDKIQAAISDLEDMLGKAVGYVDEEIGAVWHDDQPPHGTDLYTAPPAERVMVPDGWSISRSQVCNGYCVDGAGTSTLVDRGSNLYAFFDAMLSTAPEADHG